MNTWLIWVSCVTIFVSGVSVGINIGLSWGRKGWQR